MDAKYNLIVPLAGRGSRMNSTVPKAMIMAGDRTILEWSMQSIDISECDLTFIILEEQASNHGLDQFLLQKWPDCNILTIPQITRGAVETCLRARRVVIGNKPLIIFCPDVAFRPVWKPRDSDFVKDGMIVTFKANSPNYSYVRSHDQVVEETREKVVISQDAAVGLYCFKTADLFFDFAVEMIDNNIREQDEFFICPIYNLLIQNGLQVRASVNLQEVYIMGTAQELAFFKNDIFPYINAPSKFVLCSDHSGYVAKKHFMDMFKHLPADMLDVGCFSTKDCDYFDYLQFATEVIAIQRGTLGIGFCRSGQGMNIAANKVPGIRSALVRNREQAEWAIRHNGANFFAIPSGHVTDEDLQGIMQGIILGRFEGGRHQNRLMKIEAQ